MYLLGGALSGQDIHHTSPKSLMNATHANPWQTSPTSLLRERDSFTTVNIHGYIVSISGGDEKVSNSVEMYCPLDDSTMSLPSLPYCLTKVKAVVQDNQIIVTGGRFVDQPNPINTCLVLNMDNFDMKRGMKGLEWKTHEDVLQQNRECHAMCLYKDEIWIAGGSTLNHLRSTTVEVMRYDELQHQWMTESMPSMQHPRKDFELLVIQDHLYAVGGDLEMTIECYDEQSRSWSVLTTLPSYRQHCAITTDSQAIYIFGGQDKRQQYLNTVEVYVPARKSWSPKHSKITCCPSGFAYGSVVSMNNAPVCW